MKTNFAFLNRDEFLRHPVCHELYNYALNIEMYFKINEDLCAINARRYIDRYVRFVSWDVKNASYPAKCLTVGSFYGPPNEAEFLRIFGPENAEHIKQINNATKPYFHPDMERQDDLYKKLVLDIYALSWWLYYQLFSEVKHDIPEFREEYLPKEGSVIHFLDPSVGDQNSDSSYEISSFFPHYNSRLFQVEQNDGYYIVKDQDGNRIKVLYDEDSYKDVEEEAKYFKDAFSNMKDQRNKMREEVTFANGKLIGQIHELYHKINFQNNEIDVLHSITDDMNNRLVKQEDKVTEAQGNVEELFEKLNAQYKVAEKRFDERINTIEKLLTQLAAENIYLKNKLEEFDKTPETQKYINVVTNNLVSINKGYEVYEKNRNEQELRSWLLRIKNHYEEQLERLQDTIKEKDELINEFKKKERKKGVFVWVAAVSVVMIFVALGVLLFDRFMHKPYDDSDGTEALIAVDKDEYDQGMIAQSGLSQLQEDSNYETPTESGFDKLSDSSENVEAVEIEEGTSSDEIDNSDALGETDDSNSIDDSENNTIEESKAPVDVNELYSNIEKVYEAPESISTIPGINPNLVSDMENIDRSIFFTLDISEEVIKNRSDEMELIGEFGVPVIGSLVGQPRSLSCNVGGYSRLVRLKNAQSFVFVYAPGTFDAEKYGDYVAGVLPEDFCEGINNDSGYDDFVRILGSNPKPVIMNVACTELSSAENETGYLFILKNMDAVICFFDDEGKLCDYLYLFITEGGERNSNN